MRFLLITISILLLQLPAFLRQGTTIVYADAQSQVVKASVDRLYNSLFDHESTTERIYSAKRIASTFKTPEQRYTSDGIYSQWSSGLTPYDDSKHYVIDAPPSHIPISRLLLFPQHYFW